MLLFTMLVALAGAQAPTTAAATTPADPSDNEVTCRSRPVLGSRISRQRVCKTRADWRIYDNDLEMSRRDIADRGARGCGSNESEC